MSASARGRARRPALDPISPSQAGGVRQGGGETGTASWNTATVACRPGTTPRRSWLRRDEQRPAARHPPPEVATRMKASFFLPLLALTAAMAGCHRPPRPSGPATGNRPTASYRRSSPTKLDRRCIAQRDVEKFMTCYINHHYTACAPSSRTTTGRSATGGLRGRQGNERSDRRRRGPTPPPRCT